MSDVIRQCGMQYIAELPPGHLWQMAVWGGLLVFTAPDHSPMYMRGGEMHELMPLSPIENGELLRFVNRMLTDPELRPEAIIDHYRQ